MFSLPLRCLHVRRLRASGALRALLTLLALCAGLPGTAAADDVSWDGVHYLPVPVMAGSDTRLVMPEPFDDAWERDAEVACTLLDARTLIIRPRRAGIEQRLTLRGRSSGTLYLARVSSSLPYTPVVHVLAPTNAMAYAPADAMADVTANASAGAASGRSSSGVVGLLKAMMLARAPAGTRVARSGRVLLDAPPYRIVAEEVWSAQALTGVRARIEASSPGITVPVVPANILVRIPQLGTLRAMAADDFELAPAHPFTRAYLVYAR